MKESGKGSGASNKHGWLRQGLVVAEVALSLVLLLGAGLLIRNFAALVVDRPRRGPRGPCLRGPPSSSSVMSLAPPQRHHLLRQMRSPAPGPFPACRARRASSNWPYGGWRMDANRPGMQAPARDPRRRRDLSATRTTSVSCGSNPLRGRALTSADMAAPRTSPSSAASFAERYFGEEDPIGQYIELPELAKAPALLPDSTFGIIGVVDDVRNQGPARRPVAWRLLCPPR